jgi:uncharacterized protein
MKSDLDHLPERQQQELAHVRTTLLTEFEKAQRGVAAPDRPRIGGVRKIILFGSYARNDWVDRPENGYQSDFDLLIIVSHKKLTDIASYWWEAENKIMADPSVGRIVNIIVHDLSEVNQAIGKGEYFWTDIVRDGVMLYEQPGHPLAVPKPLTPRDAVAMAERYFTQKNRDISIRLDDALRNIQSADDLASRKWAAFLLHQAVETTYACFLLVHTFYFPRSHNIKFLRSLAEDVDKSLVAAWPREQRLDRRRFESLKRAYVEARYSDPYDVSLEDLQAIAMSAERLRDLVLETCKKRIVGLKSAADL